LWTNSYCHCFQLLTMPSYWHAATGVLSCCHSCLLLYLLLTFAQLLTCCYRCAQLLSMLSTVVLALDICPATDMLLQV
jgi:hypothetical protein